MMTKVVHDTDLGQTLDVASGKAEVVEILNGTKGVVYTDDRGFFAEEKDGISRINTAYIEDPTYGRLKQYSVLRMNDSSERVSFDYIKWHFDTAAAAGFDRIFIQAVGTSWQFIKSSNGDWTLSTSADGAAVTMTHGYCRTVNDAANPLFVTYDGSAVVPVDPVDDIAMYLHRVSRYMRCVDGASATIELVAPLKLRSAEINMHVGFGGYVESPIEVTINYADGSTVIAEAKPTGSVIYCTDVLDLTKPVASIKFTYRASKVVGTPSLLKLSSDGTQYAYSMPDFAAAVGDYVHVVNYINLANHNNFDVRAYPDAADLVDITSYFTVTSSIAQSAAFPLANLTDGDPATSFRPSTNVATLTLTATKNASSKLKPLIVEFTLDGAAAVGNSTLQAAVSSLVAMSSGSTLISNSRWFRDVPTGAVTIQILANSSYYLPLVADRLTLSLTKASTTQPFSISSMRILGA